MSARFDNLPPLLLVENSHGCAKFTNGVEFRLRRAVRRINRCGETEFLRHPRQSEAGVTRARGVDAMVQSVFSCSQHRISHRANLEYANGLKVFELEKNVARPVVPVQTQQWRSNDIRRKRIRRSVNFIQFREFQSCGRHARALIEGSEQVSPFALSDQYEELL